jgi:hypothetical protein
LGSEWRNVGPLEATPPFPTALLLITGDGRVEALTLASTVSAVTSLPPRLLAAAVRAAVRAAVLAAVLAALPSLPDSLAVECVA